MPARPSIGRLIVFSRRKWAIDTPHSSSWGILGSTIIAIGRWSYAISPSVRSSEEDPVPVCPTVRIGRARLPTVPTAIRSMASLVLARPSSLVPSWFYAGKGFLPATGHHEFPKNGPRGDIFKWTRFHASDQDRTPSSLRLKARAFGSIFGKITEALQRDAGRPRWDWLHY
jgi:hypothetical protein